VTDQNRAAVRDRSDESERLTELVRRLRRLSDVLMIDLSLDRTTQRNAAVAMLDAAVTIVDLGLDGLEPRKP
jgi:hypothetical protein